MPCWYVSTLVICGTGGGGELDGGRLGAGDADREDVGDGDGDWDWDWEDVGEGGGDGDAGGDVAGEVAEDVAGAVVAGGGLLVLSGDVTGATTGMMAGLGSGPGEAGADRCAEETTGAGEVGAAEVRVGTGACTNRSADGSRDRPLRAKLTAADAASTPTATPVAVSGRHGILGRGGPALRDRLDDRRGPGTSTAGRPGTGD